MQAKKRFFFICASLITLVWIYYYVKEEDDFNFDLQSLPSYFDDSWALEIASTDVEIGPSLALRRFDDHLPTSKFAIDKKCRLETCFDLSRCQKQFKVFVYPDQDGDDVNKNPLYQKILDTIADSRYYTSDPKEACLFVAGVDTLDRDPLSPEYIRMAGVKLQTSKHWNSGRNHVIFNLYSGTWPEYAEDDLGFDTGEAMLAKASMSTATLRPGFDVSIPLFPKNHPEKGGDPGLLDANNIPAIKTYLLAFKGKRYVHGIGSETRNSLYHLHNEKDVVFLATCKHGKSWKNWKDERCDEDNTLFDKYEYNSLMRNSSFCLVPRGRRLGSFRFLEALQAGCIPVLLSNGWALPFKEVIDWNKAAIWADERLLLQVPEMVRSISEMKAFHLRQQTQILWEQYFSSIEKIVFTTLEIIRQRLPLQGRDGLVWNSSPGALLTRFNLSDPLWHYPFHHDILGMATSSTFTAVIYSQIRAPLTTHTPLYRLLRNLCKSKHLSEIVLVWNQGDGNGSREYRWPSTPVPLRIVRTDVSRRFRGLQYIKTEGILSLDEDVVLNTEEIDFAFRVWRSFPDRIVGYPPRNHFWDEEKGWWSYTSKWTNDYSIVLTGGAFYHRYYNYLYEHWLSPLLLKTVEQSDACEDILMNFLVSHVTKKSPIKVTQRKRYKEGPEGGETDPDHFVQMQTCLNTFVALFGYMPLVRSNSRLDPVLFKDPVSNLRKKYRQIERVAN